MSISRSIATKSFAKYTVPQDNIPHAFALFLVRSRTFHGFSTVSLVLTMTTFALWQPTLVTTRIPIYECPGFEVPIARVLSVAIDTDLDHHPLTIDSEAS